MEGTEQGLINQNEISVLIAAPINLTHTHQCISSIRKHLPKAEIIISTWQGEPIETVDCNQLILNEHQHVLKDVLTPSSSSLLRKLILTQSGLKKCSKKYILKLSTYITLSSSKIISYTNQFLARDQQYEMFNKKIITSSYFSKKFLTNGKEHQPTPFYVSDSICFGLKEDLDNLYHIPLPKEPEHTRYFKTNPYRGLKKTLVEQSHQYAHEQYILYHAAKKKFPNLSFQNAMDYDKYNIIMSDQIIANNFIILPPKLLDITYLPTSEHPHYDTWCKFPLAMPYNLWKGLYRYDVFLNDYKKYCDNSYKTPLKTWFTNSFLNFAKEVIR